MKIIFAFAVHNVGILLFAALPMAMVVGWLQSAMFPVAWMKDLGATSTIPSPDSFLFWLLSLSPGLLVGGILHQVAMLLLSRLSTTRDLRFWYVSTSPIVLFGYAVLGGTIESSMFPRLLAPIIAGLLVYSCFLKRPLISRQGGD